jgi:Cupin domain
MTLEAKNLDSPDETRSFENGELRIVNIAGAIVGRAVFKPGWKWSNDVKPIAGTDSCQAAHTGYIISGRMHVVMDDGREADAGPGDAFVIAPGHDAWIVGDEPCVALDWSGAANYAKPAT